MAGQKNGEGIKWVRRRETVAEVGFARHFRMNLSEIVTVNWMGVESTPHLP